MSAEWYYGQGGQRGGPVDLATLQGMARSGQLRPEDLIWRAGMPNWIAASTVPEVAPSFAAPPPRAQAPQPQHGGGGGYATPADPHAPQPHAPQQYAGHQPQYGGQPQPYGNPQLGYGGYHNVPPPNSGMAITSMVLGIVSLVLCGCFPMGLVALILGMMSLNTPSRGMAIAGIVMGGISTVLGGLYWVVVLASA